MTALRGQPANPGSPGKMAVKSVCWSSRASMVKAVDLKVHLLNPSLSRESEMESGIASMNQKSLNFACGHVGALVRGSV